MCHRLSLFIASTISQHRASHRHLPPRFSARSATHAAHRNISRTGCITISTMTHDKNDCEFVVCFGALASSFGRPRHPRQPPCEAGAAAGICEKKVSKTFRENYRHSFGPSFPGMACQTLFCRILPAPKNTLFCLCFGAPPDVSKPRFLTLAPFLGSPSGRFLPDFRPNGVFQISARSENTPILPVIWCLSNFFQIAIFDFSPISGLAVGPFFHRFSAKRCFSDFRPVRKYPDFACDLVSFQFFFKTRFLTLAPFLGSPSARAVDPKIVTLMKKEMK